MAIQITLNYFIKLDKGIFYQIDVEGTATTGKIREIICEKERLWQRFGIVSSDLLLYAPPKLEVGDEESLLERVRIEGLPRLTIRQTVEQVFQLKSGEGGLDDSLVHLVVVPRPTVTTRRLTIPENQTSSRNQDTPRKPIRITEELVAKFLEGLDTRLEEYVAGPPWNSFWKAPSSAHPETKELIERLKIPCVSDNPMLLLHDLGKGIVDEDVVDNLFTARSQFLVNASGSGKTRLLFEGLIKHWGFYFTTEDTKYNYNLGSKDMKDVILNGIPKSHGWIPVPDKADDVGEAHRINYDIAERRVHQVLTARILILERLLKLARDMCPTRPINEFKMHWLFLQLCPVEILGRDVFAKLSDLLKDASNESLMFGSTQVHTRLFKIKEVFGLDEPFFLVLDEAQVAVAELHGCFCSERDLSVKHPVLKPIVSCWKAAMYLPVIVSGTSLSMDIVNDCRVWSVGGIAPFSLETKTGGFDDRERQRKYIMRYMPGHIAASDSGEAFLQRAWQYVRGRHRFTAALLVELIKTSFAAPHMILDKYVSIVSNFTPSDGRRFSERDLEADMTNVLPMSVKLSTEVPRLKYLFRDIIYTWLLTERHIQLDDKDKDLVQLGFARFINRPFSEASVDEPLVLLASAHALSNVDGFTLHDHFVSPMPLTDSPSLHPERLVAYYLVSAFDGKRKLHEIFDFRENVPQWAKQPAEIVSVDWRFEGWLQSKPFHLSEHLGSSTSIGSKSGGMEETADWFKNPSSLMCFPDATMGPDIVLFIRLKRSDERLPVVVHCKWLNKKMLPEAVVFEATKSLDPSNFFGDSTSRTPDAKDASTSVFNMFNRLDGLESENWFSRLDGPESDNWFKHGLPMLKVIASYPAVDRNHIPTDCTTLNIDPYVHLLELDTTGIAKAVAEKLTGDRRPATPDDGSTPNKKPRT